MRFSWLFALGLLCCGPAFAPSASASLVSGEMAKAGRSDCFVNPGFSTFQRNFSSAAAPGTKAVISFASAFCQGADLSGQAVMNFNSATSGNIRFKRFPTSVAGSSGLTFTNYSETFNWAERQIIVKFDIVNVFPVTLVLETP